MAGAGVARDLMRKPYRAGRRLVRLGRAPLNRLRPRRLDVCCCGLSKTGTHSFAGIFDGYRSAHHPDARLRLRLATDYLNGDVDAARAVEVLRRRDRLLWLEAESSTLAGILIEPLTAACPTKRFVLTVRDVFSWCDSWIDHNVNEPPSDTSPWGALDRVRLRVDRFTPTPHDAPLTALGLPPLPCYFQLWATHNERVLDVVPTSRLLVVKTHEITARIPELAAWAGVPVETLRADRSWLNPATERHRVLSRLDAGYVQDTADRLCGSLMHRLFPEVSWSATGSG